METISVTVTTTTPLIEDRRERTSVWLRRNADQGHLFRCMSCGAPILAYQGSVAMIVPGDAGPIMHFPVSIQCVNARKGVNSKCNALYIFEGFVV